MADLHLVDATYELFRAYFAVPSERAPDGSEVGAVGGMLGSMIRMLGGGAVTHIGCATDHVIESFRNELYAEYKTGVGLDPALMGQFEPGEEGLRALGLTVWPMVKFEADDGIASAVQKYGADFDHVIVCSPDKDFAQLVQGERVVMLDRRREITYDEPGVLEKWGVPPASIPDWLALVGDNADGFPGISGWGKKSAATVLAHYGTIEAIPESPDDWEIKVRGAKRLATNLAAAREEALLYKQLATLRRDAPLPENADELAFRGVPMKRFTAFCRAKGLNRLIRRAEGLPAMAEEPGRQ